MRAIPVWTQQLCFGQFYIINFHLKFHFLRGFAGLKTWKRLGYEIDRHEIHGKGHMYRWISWTLSRATIFGNNEMMERGWVSGINWEKVEWITWRVLVSKLILLKGFEQKLWKVMLRKIILAIRDEYASLCVCVCVCPGPGGDSVWNLPIKVDVGGKIQEIKPVVLTSTLFTFLLSLVHYQMSPFGSCLAPG